MINTTDHSVVTWAINHIKSTKKVDWGGEGGGLQRNPTVKITERL